MCDVEKNKKSQRLPLQLVAPFDKHE